MVVTYRFRTDPGHGWLEVPLADVKALGLLEKISSYSYRDGETAYLEEDCDASRFDRAAKAAGWVVKVLFPEQEDPINIRNFQPFYT